MESDSWQRDGVEGGSASWDKEDARTDSRTDVSCWNSPVGSTSVLTALIINLPYTVQGKEGSGLLNLCLCGLFESFLYFLF